MKPSEKIKEIYASLKEREKEYPYNKIYMPVEAVIQYLDEEWEKDKPCEHRDTEVNLMNFTTKCKKCGVLV